MKPCGAYIKHSSEVLQKNCNNALHAKGLTMSQLTVLHRLDAAPNGELPLKELEKQLQVAQSTATGIIARLEQKGFAEGYLSHGDRRVKLVRITGAGRACFADSRVYSVESEAHLLAPLTEEERAQFNTLLKKVSEGL